MLGLVVALSGCANPPRTLTGDSYLIDTERGLMCHVTECYYLDLVNASFDELEVAKAFGLPVKAYSWTTSQFVTLLVEPPQGLYSVAVLSETEYQLPKNPATDAAFNLLYKEDLLIYKIGGEGKSL